MSVLILFAAFLVCGLIISLNAPDEFGRYLSFGITVSVTFQATFNMAMTMGMVPTKGLALPFFSYGGSFLLACYVAVGLTLRVAEEGRELGYRGL